MRAKTFNMLAREFKYEKNRYKNKDKESLLLTINSLYMVLERFRKGTTGVYLENEYLRRRVFSLEKRLEALGRMRGGKRNFTEFSTNKCFSEEIYKKIQKVKEKLKIIRNNTTDEQTRAELSEALHILRKNYKIEDFVDIEV